MYVCESIRVFVIKKIVNLKFAHFNNGGLSLNSIDSELPFFFKKNSDWHNENNATTEFEVLTCSHIVTL